MWHASVCGNLTGSILRGVGRTRLRGVGDTGHEWVQEGKPARGSPVVHVRRRLTQEEAEAVGPLVDVRGTPRHREIAHMVAFTTGYPEGMLMEMG